MDSLREKGRCPAADRLIAELESGLAPDPVREIEGLAAAGREELTGITDIIRGPVGPA